MYVHEKRACIKHFWEFLRFYGIRMEKILDALLNTNLWDCSCTYIISLICAMVVCKALAAIFFIFLSMAYVTSVEIPKQLLKKSSIANKETEIRAVQQLVHRTLLEKDIMFEIDINKALDYHTFQIFKTTKNKIRIIGYDGVSAAKGFHYYLKYYLNISFNWYNKPIVIKDDINLPDVNVTSTSSSDVLYYQNVCTWGYSFVWWNWSKWVEHIDWMAMMGITLTIAPIQEELWYETFLELGLSEHDINQHMTGPAFLPWLRMGNVHGWGGPIGPTYRKMQQILQQKIIKQQRELGMIVAVPSFSGHLPIAIQKIYSKSNFSVIDRWNKFPKTLCCELFLDPNDTLFQNITNIFLNKVIDAYGTDHVYFADPFNEIQPRTATPSYLNMTAYHIFNSMRSVDNAALWLMQGWMFVHNIFWSDKLVSAFLTAVPFGGLLILDLQSEQFPQYERTHSYYGHPFIWCMLHNFGGTLGMHGSVNYVNQRIGTARSMENSTMIGVGITPEGINQNYVMYELALERGWLNDNINLTAWFNKFSDVQYGIESAKLRTAWQLLRQSVYSYYGLKKIRGKYVIARRPSTRLDVWTWYKFSDIYKSWSNFLLSNASIPSTHYNNFENDLVDITRQCLQAISDRIYVNLIDAFKRNETKRLDFLSQEMFKLLDDMDSILSTHKNYLLGIWLESSRNLATSDEEKHQFEFNGRNQISLWGPSGQIVDYATKQWSGIVRDFYKPRWQLFLNQLSVCLATGEPFNNTLFSKTILTKVEQPFTLQRKRYPTLPHGNTFNISSYIFRTWSNFLSNKTILHNMLKVGIKYKYYSKF